jgi:hypothetical protein
MTERLDSEDSMLKRSLLAAAALIAALACSDSFQPTVENVIGSYTARTFTITDGAGTTDLVKAGAVFTLELGPRGSTSGYLYIPAVGGDPEVIEEIDGTWTLAEGLILIDQTGGSFLQNMGFFAYRTQLYASRSNPSVQIRALLTK